ncbi:MAG: hypothetical protein KGS45_03715 [Planctomycetes bacterium]|nr:hypothetical protein [Planctomycetota bacterium]
MLRRGPSIVLACSLVVAAGGLALLSGVGRQPETARPGPQVEGRHDDLSKQTGVAVEWMGSYSSIQTPRVELVESASAWEALYTEHTREKPEKNANGFVTWPKIDFDKFAVVALFAGKSKNSNGYEGVSVTESVAGVLVRVDQIHFQTASFDGKDAGIATTAFGFLVIPRRVGAWMIEENTQNLIGGPPQWTEIKRFGVKDKLPGVK